MHDTRKKKYSVWSDDFLYAHMLVHYAACRWKWSFGMTSVYGTIWIPVASARSLNCGHVEDAIRPDHIFFHLPHTFTHMIPKLHDCRQSMTVVSAAVNSQACKGAHSLEIGTRTTIF